MAIHCSLLVCFIADCHKSTVYNSSFVGETKLTHLKPRDLSEGKIFRLEVSTFETRGETTKDENRSKALKAGKLRTLD